MSNEQQYNEQLSVACDTAYLDNIRMFVEESARKLGFGEQISFNIALAVDEACSNLIRHGYKFDSSQSIVVEISADDTTFRIAIHDQAESFNPLSVETPDMKEYFRQYRSGGLGIHIIRTVMDEVKYMPASPSHPFNTLLLAKRRASAGV